MHDPLVIGLLTASLVVSVVILLQISRIIKMSETFDTELSETEAAIGVLTDAVNHAADKFTDLAKKLQAAIDALSQQGITAQQLSRFNDIQSHLSDEAAALTAAANVADPDPAPPADTPPGGDDTIAGPTGDDTVDAPSGDDTLPGGEGDDSIPT